MQTSYRESGGKMNLTIRALQQKHSVLEQSFNTPPQSNKGAEILYSEP